MAEQDGMTIDEVAIQIVQESMTAEIMGVVTPPPSPCGNPHCGYVEFDLIHTDTCSEKEEE